MESTAVSSRKHTNNRGNKENTLPAQGPKSFIKGDKTSAVPFQLQGNKKQIITTKKQSLPAKSKAVDSKAVLGAAQRKVLTVQRDVKATAPDVQRATKQEQAGIRKTTAEALKSLPAAAVPSSKSAPGMFRGKIVQSKIGSIWKSSNAVGTLKPSVPRSDDRRDENVSKKNGSRSVVDVPMRSKSVSDKPAQVTKASVSTSRPAGSFSHRPPARTVSASLKSARSRPATVAPNKPSGNANTKPKIPVTDKVNKAAALSSLSQYRVTMETKEERRAKLAEWKASKGKTLKRPAMTPAAPSNKVPAKGKVEVQSHVEPVVAAECRSEAEPRLQPAAAAELQGQVLTHGPPPEVMNTTLDLLENSDIDLSAGPQDRVDDIVMNLCDALESLVTPSRCSDELEQVKEECDDAEHNQPECMQEVKNERIKAEEVKEESDQEDSEDVMETPDMKDASVIKYSVKTTPYLQSVKKTIDEEVGTSTSKKKGSIKDLKFLTPVRRSCRIQRKSSCLPSMLVDHDPCVSSLAELVQLNDDANAYIYRKNPALLQELPDQDRP